MSFTIAPKTTSKVTVSQIEGTITLKWKKVTGADGYAIFQYTTEGWKRIKTIKSPDTLSYTVKKLRPGTGYKFRIKAYTKDSTGWGGIDISGATYDEYGVLEICPYCGKTKGVGTNMCNGCNIIIGF